MDYFLREATDFWITHELEIWYFISEEADIEPLGKNDFLSAECTYIYKRDYLDRNFGEENSNYFDLKGNIIQLSSFGNK